MATYTHVTPARYTNANRRDATSKVYTRQAKGLLSRLRPTLAASVNAKRIFGLVDIPTRAKDLGATPPVDDYGFGGTCVGTAFDTSTGIVTRTYRGGTTAIGGKARTR